MKLRKLLSATLSAALIIATMSIPAFADKADAPVVDVAEEATTVPSEEPTPEATPTPTTEADLIISNYEELANFALQVNDGNNYRGKKVLLTDDIDLTGKEWTPIATSRDNAFVGIFDGGNHTISGLTIGNSDTPAGSNQGVFGFVWDGTLQNVIVSGINITGSENLGGLAGVLVGTASNCHAKDVSVDGTHFAGGLVGYGYANYDSCTADNVTVKLTRGAVTDNDEGGAIAGFMGEGTFEVIDCQVTNSNITGSRDVGGIIGSAAGPGELTFTNCTVDDKTTVEATLGFPWYLGAKPAAGGILGRTLTTTSFIDCSSQATVKSTISGDAGKFVGVIDTGGSVTESSREEG